MGGNLKQGFGLNAGGGSGGDTNTNIANDDLTLNANYYTDTNSQTLTFKNGSNNTAQMNALGLSIGAATPYTMPTARAGTEGKVLTSSDTTTGTAWRNSGFVLPFQMFLGSTSGSVNSTNYYYPEPMNNNKHLALVRDSSISNPASWNILTSTTVRSCTLGSVPAAINLNALNFHASVLDNAASATPAVTVEIWSIPITSGSADQITPESAITGTTAATGDSNNKFYLGRATSGSDVAANNLLMPVFKLVFEEAPEELDFDVWIVGSVKCYYTG